MVASDTETPPPRITAADRSSSTQSITKASPTSRPRQHKVHVVGQGGLGKSRNTSYGRNLNHLGQTNKSTRDDGGTSKGQKKRRESPSGGHVKRNSSTVSLPRTGSKVSIKRNSSNVSLKRNGSSTHVKQTSRPTTPTHNKSQSKDLKDATSRVAFEMDDDNNDDDWTEESNSQSPSITRHSSTRHSPSSRGGGRSGAATPAEHNTRDEHAGLARSPPQTPGLDEAQDGQNLADYLKVGSSSQHPYPPRSATNDNQQPDASAITSRLLKRNASYKVDPQVSSVSAAGTPGTQTPPTQWPGSGFDSQGYPSMPANGRSHFIGAPSDSNASTWVRPNALSGFATPPTPGANDVRTRSPSPDRDTLRSSKSAHNLARSRRPKVHEDPSAKGTSMIFEQQHIHSGGNTAFRAAIDRDHWRVDANPNPPPPMLKGPNAIGVLPPEERRARLFDEAEAELNYLRRFRNPVLEATKRVIKARKRRERESKGKAPDTRPSTPGHEEEERRRHSLDRTSARGSVNGQVGTSPGSRHGNEEGARKEVSRPPSRRNVRFEVGLDPADELAESPEQTDGLEALLRGLWAGGEMENVGE